MTITKIPFNKDAMTMQDMKKCVDTVEYFKRRHNQLKLDKNLTNRERRDAMAAWLSSEMLNYEIED